MAIHEFTRKQIKAIIVIITSEKTLGRDGLRSIRICSDNCAYITDGYVAIRWKFDSKPLSNNQKELVIPAENLIRWYKLANPKDKLNEYTILELVDEKNDTSYPDMNRLFRERKNHLTKSSVKMDLNLIEKIHKVTNCRNYLGYELTIYGDMIYGIEIKRKDIDFLVIGLN